eukprot:comp50512_c0_seq1/m.47648 comp50512_c0_seq1/g.47648  ORF comp50512_c0_seq1/g.47648 comp50512_c0_seq1/m.47648 type:complete len:414 (-) comp50512_c0_seq1:141-1382(-)
MGALAEAFQKGLAAQWALCFFCCWYPCTSFESFGSFCVFIFMFSWVFEHAHENKPHPAIDTLFVVLAIFSWASLSPAAKGFGVSATFLALWEIFLGVTGFSSNIPIGTFSLFYASSTIFYDYSFITNYIGIALALLLRVFPFEDTWAKASRPHTAKEHGRNRTQGPTHGNVDSKTEASRILSVTTHYEVLQVDASLNGEVFLDAVRVAYRRKALLVHPDKNGNEEQFHKAFQQLQAAYQTLSDEDERKKYDFEMNVHGIDECVDPASGVTSFEMPVSCHYNPYSAHMVRVMRQKNRRSCNKCAEGHVINPGELFMEETYEWAPFMGVVPFFSTIRRVYVYSPGGVVDITSQVNCCQTRLLSFLKPNECSVPCVLVEHNEGRRGRNENRNENRSEKPWKKEPKRKGNNKKKGRR